MTTTETNFLNFLLKKFVKTNNTFLNSRIILTIIHPPDARPDTLYSRSNQFERTEMGPCFSRVGGEMGSPSWRNDRLFGLHLARVFSLVFGAMPKSNPSGAFKYLKKYLFLIYRLAGWAPGNYRDKKPLVDCTLSIRIPILWIISESPCNPSRWMSGRDPCIASIYLAFYTLTPKQIMQSTFYFIVI